MQEGSAGSLLGLVGSLAMGTLAKSARDRGLDASGVLNLLGREEAMPGDFAKALQGAGLLDSVTDRVTLVPPAAAAPVKPAPAPPRPAATSAPVRTPAPPPGRPWWHCWWG